MHVLTSQVIATPLWTRVHLERRLAQTDLWWRAQVNSTLRWRWDAEILVNTYILHSLYLFIRCVGIKRYIISIIPEWVFGVLFWAGDSKWGCGNWLLLTVATVSHCCSHSPAATGESDVHQPWTHAFATQKRFWITAIPLHRVHVKGVKILYVEVAAACLQCSAERITKPTFSHSCGNIFYTNFLENNFTLDGNYTTRMFWHSNSMTIPTWTLS